MTYDHWKTTEPDDGDKPLPEDDGSDDGSVYARLGTCVKDAARLRASHDRLLSALRGMLGFNVLLLNHKDLPADIPYELTSNHRVKEAVAAIAAAGELAP